LLAILPLNEQPNVRTPLMSFHRFLGSITLLLLLLTLGCNRGPLPSRVSGKVTKNGSPVKGGTMAFHAKEGGVYRTAIRPDGTYSITDLPAGQMDVTIETESVKPSKKATYGKAKASKNPIISKGPEGQAPQGEPAEYVPIPLKYGAKATSGLNVTLSAGEQEHNFELTEN
jgi:hypothetical protein